LLTASQVGYR